MQRFLLIVGIFLLVLFLLPSLVPTPDAYFSMQVENVNARPQLVLQYLSNKLEPFTPYISVYTPKGESPDEWEPLMENRQGPAYGAFSVRALSSMDPAHVRRIGANAELALAYAGVDPRVAAFKQIADAMPEPRLSERLGLFHPQRMSLVDVSKRPPEFSFAALPFKWAAETTAELKGVTYAFGVEAPERLEESAAAIKGRLKVARFNGVNWDELKTDSPEVETFPPGFLLKAVTLGDKIRVFWRNYESDQLLAARLEGFRVVTAGKLRIAEFDGQNFGKDIETVANLPRGNISAWSDGTQIAMLIQTRGKLEDSPAVSGPMEIWGLVPGNPAAKLETLGGEGSRGGLLAYIAAERFTFNGQEYILRSNWQKFELWTRDADRSWKMTAPNVKLPNFNVEGMLISSLFLGLAMLAFSAGLAWRRRAVAPGQKIHPREIYATLGVRMGAFTVDLFVIIALAYAASKLLGMPYVSPLELLQIDLGRNKWPFFIIYIVYLTLTEGLLGFTAGKYVMGLRVLMFNGKKLTLPSAAIRNLTGFFERMPQVVLVPMFMMIFSPYRQRLGDLLSRSIVVHKNTLEAFKSQRAAELAAMRSEGESKLPSLDVLVGAGKENEKQNQDKGQ
ncbi:MAG TPA: RDD family protein [Planctomycetota bacterium]|nr:RDD family protein [Planctomycetota bacterium]